MSVKQKLLLVTVVIVSEKKKKKKHTINSCIYLLSLGLTLSLTDNSI